MLSKSSEYAIRALVFIQIQNWEKRRPGVIEIAREIEAPAAFSAKILHTLTTHRLLDSMKGRGGGFFFPNGQSDLTLYKVIHIMEGDKLFSSCGIGLKSCSDTKPCPLHEQYTPIRNSLIQLVNSETISSLAQRIRDGKAVLKKDPLKHF
ncbi:MAG: Rrf2 family transcriptional regulator [Bacteroidales bacterium]